MSKNSLHSRLRQISDHINRIEKTTEQKQNIPSRYALLTTEMGGELIQNCNGSFCLIRKDYQFGYKHGSFELSKSFLREAIELSSFTVQESEEVIPLSDLLFFDTETTGLGGAGVVPFLVGFGSFSQSGFEVRQYLLPDYADEAAMLEAISEELSDNRTLVSYNGAAFDLPLLRDRFIVNRVAREVPHQHHIDLLHPTRRLFRKRLADCSLTNVERELLAFHRVDDIPGYLVPSVYFDWLNEQSLTQMEAVVEHNRFDIVSLGFLLCMINEILLTEGATLSHADDLHSLSRLYYRRREEKKVLQLNRKVRSKTQVELDSSVQLYHAQTFKRTKDWPEAVKLWISLARNKDRAGFLARIELSKYYEHRETDLLAALEYAETAIKSVDLTYVRHADLSHRISRLRKKLQKT